MSNFFNAFWKELTEGLHFISSGKLLYFTIRSYPGFFLKRDVHKANTITEQPQIS